jgi:UDP-3-O-[3-hydroxymyristoyl] glucosamine N-acyltransferase
MPASLGELAVRFGCELRGDPQRRIERVGTLAEADERAIAFLANPRYRKLLAGTRAGAVILDADAAAECLVDALVASNPYAIYARVASMLHPTPIAEPGVHATAVVAPDASVDATAHVAAQAVVGARVRVGARSYVGPGCVLEEGASVGEDSRLAARVVLGRDVRLGARAILHPGAVVGADGFGFAPERGKWLKVPQVGSVTIGDDVEIGANTTIDRGAIGDTVIEDGVKLDNQIQIGHNVRIGAHTAIAACVGISGSVTIGKRCQIGGAVGIVGHLSICDDVAVTGYSMVSRSIVAPGVYSGGIPAETAEDWRRIVARLKRIEQLAERVRRLEKDERHD